MTTGFFYGELEPKERCPYCGALCCADFVDVGIGFQQCGPYHCENCKASEIGPYDEHRDLNEEEQLCGWYAPGSPPGSSANTSGDGRIITHYEADTQYRLKKGVAPRYDKYGNLIVR